MNGGTSSILIIGGGAAGWLSATYLAKALALPNNRHLAMTRVESPDIGIIGRGEGMFPTIRQTLRFLDIDERSFIRESSATATELQRPENSTWRLARTPAATKDAHRLRSPLFKVNDRSPE